MVNLEGVAFCVVVKAIGLRNMVLPLLGNLGA